MTRRKKHVRHDAQYEARKDGLYSISANGRGVKVGPPITHVGHASRENGSGAADIVQFLDKEGVERELCIPLAVTLGDRRKFTDTLIDGAYPVAGWPKAVLAVQAYLEAEHAKSKQHILIVKIGGWHGPHFLLGPTLISPNGMATGLRWDGPQLLAMEKFRVAGTLSKWQTRVARRCAYSSRMMFGLCLSFTAPLRALLDVEGGGFHNHGAPESAKTAGLIAAGSVFGGGEKNGHYVPWAMTDAGAETLCLIHNDVLLCLDELDRFDTDPVRGAKRLGPMVLDISGEGSRTISHRASIASSPVKGALFLSSGNSAAMQYVAKTGQEPIPGMASRIVDIPLPAEGEMGMFDRLPNNKKTGQPFDHSDYARLIAVASLKNYGHAGHIYLQKLVQERHDDPVRLKRYLLDRMNYFTAKTRDAVPAGYDQRVVRRFALNRPGFAGGSNS
jgi:hypothetical protein